MDQRRRASPAGRELPHGAAVQRAGDDDLVERRQTLPALALVAVRRTIDTPRDPRSTAWTALPVAIETATGSSPKRVACAATSWSLIETGICTGAAAAGVASASTRAAVRRSFIFRASRGGRLLAIGEPP